MIRGGVATIGFFIRAINSKKQKIFVEQEMKQNFLLKTFLKNIK